MPPRARATDSTLPATALEVGMPSDRNLGHLLYPLVLKDGIPLVPIGT